MSTTTRKRAVRAVAPVAGLLAAGLLVWQGSYAAFSATTDNTNDAWSTGTMALTNNGGGTTYAGSTSALFTETELNFGDSAEKCITVESNGSLGGNLALFRGTVTGALANGDPSTVLGDQLRLSVTAAPLATATDNVAADCTGFPTTSVTTLATNATLNSFPSSYGTAPSVVVADGATSRVAYRIAWTLLSTGSALTDNPLQGSSVQANLNWELQ
jgi:hypothetical protein